MSKSYQFVIDVEIETDDDDFMLDESDIHIEFVGDENLEYSYAVRKTAGGD